MWDPHGCDTGQTRREAPSGKDRKGKTCSVGGRGCVCFGLAAPDMGKLSGRVWHPLEGVGKGRDTNQWYTVGLPDGKMYSRRSLGP